MNIAHKRYLVIAGALLFTAVAAFIGGRWVISPIVDFTGGLGDIQPLIEKSFPVRLINPSWIKVTDDDLIPKWNIAEFKARGVAVFISWLTLMLILGRWEHRLRNELANQMSHRPTSSLRAAP